MSPEKLTILCLHGYTQNGEVFRARVGSLRKALKSRAEFVFLDAPFEAKSLPGQAEAVDGGRSWWDWVPNPEHGEQSARPSLSPKYLGWEQTTGPLLVEALRTHRPHGILGFSQGATATAFLAAELEFKRRTGRWRWEAPEASLSKPTPAETEREADDGVGAGEGNGSASDAVAKTASADDEYLDRLRFAVMISGFMPYDPTFRSLLQEEQPRSLAYLFVGGATDEQVTLSRTADLLRCFAPPRRSTLTHGGAHMVPTCSGAFKAALLKFVDAAAAAVALDGQVVVPEPFHVEAEGLEGRGIPTILADLLALEDKAPNKRTEASEKKKEA